MEEIILVGYGGHAKSVADSIKRAKKYEIIGYTDIEEKESPYDYLGTDDILKEYYHRGIRNVVICIGQLGDGAIRENLYISLKKIGFNFPVIFDPSAVISETSKIGEGSFIGKGVVINSNAVIGKLSIVNTQAVVEHDCVIGDFSHIAVGAVLCGGVEVSEQSFVGANATILQTIKVGKKSIIGAGSVVTKDVPDDCKVVGVPARII